MASFRRFEAWRLCHALALEIHRVTDTWPKSERYELTSQVRRAAFSAAVNIVEGASRSGPKEFARFLDISVSSLAELEYALIFAKDYGLLTEAQWLTLEERRRHASVITWKLLNAVRGGRR